MNDELFKLMLAGSAFVFVNRHVSIMKGFWVLGAGFWVPVLRSAVLVLGSGSSSGF